MTKNRVFNSKQWGVTFPRADDGRMLKVNRIYHTEYSMGECGCCEADAHFQIEMHDIKGLRKDGKDTEKTTFFACHAHAGLFSEDYDMQADLKVKAWDDGWEIVCDFCGAFCPDKPHVYRNTTPPRAYKHTLCEECYDMETLFA